MSSVFGGSFGGGYGGRFDTDLQAKVDKALAGKKSQQDKMAEFMKKDLGIDPGALPMTAKQARIRINTIMQDRNASACTFNGNSLGIKNVQFTENTGNVQKPCTTCGNQDTYDKQDGAGNWFCYDCDADFVPVVTPSTEKPIDQSSKDKDWSDMMRCYKALQKDENYSFQVGWTYTYRGNEQECGEPQVIHTEVEPDPRFLSIGLTVRLCKKNLNGPDEYVYAKKGGLFNDSDVVELPSMKPITDIQSWTVVEIL